MSIIEKQFGRESNLYVPPEEYPTYIAIIITERVGVDPDDVAGRLQIFFDGCAEDLRAYKFDRMPPRAAQLELDLRQVKLMSRPDEGKALAQRQSISARCHIAGWVSPEVDVLLKAAGAPENITEITWRGAKLKSGLTLDRHEIREHLRAAAFSDEGWQKFLASMPKIQAPEVVQ